MQLDHYEIEHTRDGQPPLTAHLVLQQTLAVTVGLEVHHDDDLDEELAREIAERFLEDKLHENPSLAIGAWWKFYDARRITYQMVEVTFTLDQVQFPDLSHSAPGQPNAPIPGVYVHVTERDEF